jgi:hypothetical protein
VQKQQICTQNFHLDQETDQQKTDAKKAMDPKEILVIKKKLHKAKRTFEDF